MILTMNSIISYNTRVLKMNLSKMIKVMWPMAPLLLSIKTVFKIKAKFNKVIINYLLLIMILLVIKLQLKAMF